MDNLLDEVVAALMSSAKYREISPALLRQIAAQELSKRRSLKEAVKAAKNKLHQIAGAYFGELPNFAAWQATLAGAAAAGEDLRPLCRQWLAAHASTRERVPLLEQFYTRIFEGLPPIHSLLDLACGLNPLTLHVGGVFGLGAHVGNRVAQRQFAVNVHRDMAIFQRHQIGRKGNRQRQRIVQRARAIAATL